MPTELKKYVDDEHPQVVKIPNRHIRGAPLFELSVIKISNGLLHYFGCSGSAIEVYGHIRLIDDKGNMFTLFKLDYENAKRVILEDNSDGFSVVLRKPQLGSPRCLPENLNLHIVLKDRIQDFTLFEGWKFLSFSHDVCYDSMMYHNVVHILQKSHMPVCSLELGYTVFHCALLAYVSAELLSVGNDDNYSNVTLTASIDLLKSKSNVFHELFDDNPMVLKFGAPKELCVLAVPVYSALKIIATFISDDDTDADADGTERIVRELEFNPVVSSRKRFEKKIQGQNCQMLVSVTWGHPSFKLPENFLREWGDAPSSSDSDSDSDSDSVCEIEQGDSSEKPPRMKPFPSKFKTRLSHSSFCKQKIYHKRLKHMEPLDNMKGTCDKNGYFIQPLLKNLEERIWFVTSCQNELVELFCVSICPFDDNDGGASSITGRIDCSGSFTLGTKLDYFSAKDFKTGIIYPHVTGKCIMGPNFHMKLELKDFKGNQISHGYLEYNDLNVVPWYNRRACSVVVGERGYAAAAAYYTIFEDAQQARLKIRLLPDNGAVVCLHGTIHDRYDNFNYFTRYEKDYFQIVIFKKGKSESVNGGGEVPLTKSVVAVPFNGSLIVKANLCVMLDDKRVGTIKGKATLKPGNDDKEFTEVKIIGGSSTYYLQVNVVWGTLNIAQK